MGRGEILDRVAKKSLTEKVAFEKKRKNLKKLAMQISGRRAFQAGGILSGRSLSEVSGEEARRPG